MHTGLCVGFERPGWGGDFGQMGRTSMKSTIVHIALEGDGEQHSALVSEILGHFNCSPLSFK